VSDLFSSKGILLKGAQTKPVCLAISSWDGSLLEWMGLCPLDSTLPDLRGHRKSRCQASC